MSISSFEELLSLLSPYLQKRSYKGRIPVMPLEMIGLTIRPIDLIPHWRVKIDIQCGYKAYRPYGKYNAYLPNTALIEESKLISVVLTAFTNAWPVYKKKKQIQILQDVIVKPASTSSETTTFQEPRCSSSIAFQEPSFSSTLHDSSMRVSPQVRKTYLDFTPKRKKIQKAENDVYVSPSTGNTLHVLENAVYGLDSTPIRKYYNLRKETPVTPNVSNLTSRTSSISDISCAKSLLCPLFNEEICAIYNTQTQNNQSSLTNLNISTIYGKDLNPDASNNNYTPNPSEKICAIYDTQTQNEQSSLTYLNIPANSAKDFEPDSSDDSYAPNSSDLETDSSYSDDSDSDDSVITYYENSSETELVQILENTQCTENNNFDEWEDINDTKPDFDEFTDNCRPNIPDNTITSADFYSLFVTDEIIEQMVINTNNYAQGLISNLSNLKPKSRLRA
ncbi:unnamed protein product [Parnassius apollo]|uniref:(apollo) hypothetical protein n=1 Tax=Parnassius apollo TaxID=110799 RepID=A0A8S3WW48_PARAO|nr:unnamed protein product [Parnassius apollo]